MSTKIRTYDEILAVCDEADWSQLVISVPWGTSMIDHRAFDRLLMFLSFEDAEQFLADGASETGWNQASLTRERIMIMMKSDLSFAFDKALGQRSISANLMHQVMCMYLWLIGDDELLEDMDYTDYGLADLSAIRDKYFPGMEVRK